MSPCLKYIAHSGLNNNASEVLLNGENTIKNFKHVFNKLVHKITQHYTGYKAVGYNNGYCNNLLKYCYTF